MNNPIIIHQPTTEQIATRAYLIWEKKGRLPGCDVAHWIEAERQLVAENDCAGAAMLHEIRSRTAGPPRPGKSSRTEAITLGPHGGGIRSHEFTNGLLGQ